MIQHYLRMFSFLLHRKKVNRVKEYIEGTISESAFFHELTVCKTYQRLYYRASWDSFSSPLLERKLVDKDLGSLTEIDRVTLQIRLASILDYYRISYVVRVPELALWEKWEGYVPSFLDPSLDLMKEMEHIDPNQEKTKKWHKERFRKIYPYEKYPPRWLQWCEWPVDEDGKHCLFLYQTGFPNSKDFIEYHFRKSSGEEVVVEQYD